MTWGSLLEDAGASLGHCRLAPTYKFGAVSPAPLEASPPVGSLDSKLLVVPHTDRLISGCVLVSIPIINDNGL